VQEITGMASAGVPPRIMGIGPVPSTPQLMERSDCGSANFGRDRADEAFASQGLAGHAPARAPDDAEHVNRTRRDCARPSARHVGARIGDDGRTSAREDRPAGVR